MTTDCPRGPLEPIVGRLREAAAEIARHGHAGWGNQMTEAADEIERLRVENDLWKSQVHDEIAANLAFRAAGGALQDEDMPTFCARIIAERDALRARIASLEESTHYANGVADLAMKHRDVAEARIDGAPTVSIVGISPTAGYFGYTNPSGGFFEESFADCPECPILGKRVALVVVDD